MTAPFEHSLDEINAMLQARAFDLAVRIFGAGAVRRHGNQAWILNPARKDPNWTSFSVNLASGVWKDFSDASGETGGKGLLSLIAAFATRGNYKGPQGAVAWAKSFLGLSDRPLSDATRKHFAERAAKAAQDEVMRAERSRRGALAYWTQAMRKQDGATPLTGFDPASLYLANRGIDVIRMREGFPRPLAFHPKVWAYDPIEAHYRGPHPALIACISLEGLPNGFAALHRTYLTQHQGEWLKLTWERCKTGKQVKGAWAGGSIRLTRGKSGKPLASAPDGELVQITEGIEDGLTVAIAEPDTRTLVGVSVSNIGGLVLPRTIKSAQIWRQNDEKAAAIAQFDLAMDKLAERGIEPWIIDTDQCFKDPNDVLRGKPKVSSSALCSG